MNDIIIRDCGAVGFLGIAMIDGKEVYRTGSHCQNSQLCLMKVMAWMQKNGGDNAA